MVLITKMREKTHNLVDGIFFPLSLHKPKKSIRKIHQRTSGLNEKGRKKNEEREKKKGKGTVRRYGTFFHFFSCTLDG
jgi:hypothetical protein